MKELVNKHTEILKNPDAGRHTKAASYLVLYSIASGSCLAVVAAVVTILAVVVLIAAALTALIAIAFVVVSLLFAVRMMWRLPELALVLAIYIMWAYHL